MRGHPPFYAELANALSLAWVVVVPVVAQIGCNVVVIVPWLRQLMNCTDVSTRRIM